MAQNQQGGKKGRRKKLPTTRRAKSPSPPRRTLPAYPKGICLSRQSQTAFLVAAGVAYVLLLVRVIGSYLGGVMVFPRENFVLLIACVVMPVWFVFRYAHLVKFGPREGIKSVFLNAVILLFGLLLVHRVPNAEHWFLVAGLLMVSVAMKGLETTLNYSAGRTSRLRLGVMRRKAIEDGAAAILLWAPFALLRLEVVKQEWRALLIGIAGGLWIAWVILECFLERPQR